MTPECFRSIVRWFGISDRVRFICRPLLARPLYVLPQQERLLNVGSSPEYLDAIDRLVSSKQLLREKVEVYLFLAQNKVKGWLR